MADGEKVMIYGSVCSGIEAATVAWHGLGWKPSFFSEIEKFPRDVLAHHYPETPLHGDFTTIKKDDYEPISLLVGGTPCQSFSVAGLRAGLNDPRGNLMLEFGALANRLQPKWLVWENVPGVLSSNDGKDFGSFLAMLAELGYGFSYRVLDAQYFGVPQRRRRVFVIGCFGDWRSAAAVLFERDSLQGHPAPSRGERKEVTEIAGTLTSNGGGLNRPAGNANELDFCVTVETAKTLITKTRLDSETETFIPCFALAGNTIGRQPENGGNGTGYDDSGVSYTLTKTDQHAVAYGVGESPDLAHCLRSGASKADKHESTTYVAQPVAIPINTMTMMGRPSDDINPRMGSGIGEPGDPQNTLTKAHSHAVFHNMQVRRLTPMECERLQGFPDNYSKIPGASDSPRYKALGNSMAVPVMRWIGERIQKVEAMQ
jgi:DNA (cytosine-5)-methyltransferase 1